MRKGEELKAPRYASAAASCDDHVTTHDTGVMQTASGLPKKSLEERKVSSEGGRSKASGGKKEGLKAAASSGEAGLQGTRDAEEGERR